MFNVQMFEQFSKTIMICIQTIIVLISKIANTKQEQIFISNTFPFIEKEKNCAQEKMLGVVR